MFLCSTEERKILLYLYFDIYYIKPERIMRMDLKTPTIILLVGIILTFFGCVLDFPDNKSFSADSVRNAIAARESLIAAGRREWKDETFGDAYRKVSPYEAMAASKRAVALSDLKNIHRDEIQFFIENDRFTENFDELFFKPRYGKYSYSLHAFGTDSLKIIATANLDKDDFLDVIVMNEEGAVTIVEDDLKNLRLGPAVSRTSGYIKMDRPTGRTSGKVSGSKIGIGNR